MCLSALRSVCVALRVVQTLGLAGWAWAGACARGLCPAGGRCCLQVGLLVDAVRDKAPVPEGFQIIIDSMAGL